MEAEAKDKMEAETKGVESALDVNFEVEEDQTAFRVPRLDDLCIQKLASVMDLYPSLDHIQAEYIPALIELVNTKKISFNIATKYIKNEKFWEKSTKQRWQSRPLEIAEHGMSWRRLYSELHLQEQLEQYYPSKCGTNFEALTHVVEAAKPFVQTIRFRQLRSHIDLSQVLDDFQNLQTLDLTYGIKDIGMGYERTAFGMKLNDAMSLARLIPNCFSLTRLILKENLLNDENIQVLGSGLSKNNTITFLDLSHNKIGNLGAQTLANLLHRGSILIDLNLTDNAIRLSGAEYLAMALEENFSLGILSLSQNAITDAGGAKIISSLDTNQSLFELDLSVNGLEEKSAAALVEMVKANASLKEIKMAGNKVVGGNGEALLNALEVNKSLTALDLRRNADTKVLEPFAKMLRPRKIKEKQARRKRYQDGWDLLD